MFFIFVAILFSLRRRLVFTFAFWSSSSPLITRWSSSPYYFSFVFVFVVCLYPRIISRLFSTSYSFTFVFIFVLSLVCLRLHIIFRYYYYYLFFLPSYNFTLVFIFVLFLVGLCLLIISHRSSSYHHFPVGLRHRHCHH